MVNVAKVTKALSRLTLMKFFPSDDAARTALVELVCGMITSEDQADWLAKRMLTIYDEWPGTREMRACFCARFKPKDGINAYSKIFLEEMPPDPDAPKRIEAPKPKPLPPGHVATFDVKLDADVKMLAEERKMLPAKRVPYDAFARTLRATITAPNDRPEPTPQIITAEDVNRAMAEHKAKKALEGGNG